MASTKAPVLVTGAAGFIAFHLISKLLRDGQPVVGLDNFDAFYDRSIKEENLSDLRAIARETGTRFDFQGKDLLDLDADFCPDDRFSEIVHLAAKAGVRPSLVAPLSYLKTNVEGTLRVLEFARHRAINRVVFGSSSSVYGDQTPVPFNENAMADRPVSPYAASKRACELYCANYSHLYGITCAALRFFTVYGARQRPDLAIHRFSRQIVSGEVITLYGDGTTERDYTFVDDIVQGVIGAMEWTRQSQPGTYDAFNLGGSKTTSLIALVRLIEGSLGISAKIRWEPMQPGDVRRTFADVGKSQRLLGYHPTISPEAGIPRFMEWFEAHRVRSFRTAA